MLMNILWTPWRIKYILGGRSADCMLCQKAQEPEQRDRENYVLYRGRACFVMLNLYPYTNGHLMVAPYCHEANLPRLDDATLNEITALTRAAVAALERDAAPSGFNIGMNVGKFAGAGVTDHVHMNVVPRWEGDVNFMSVLAETRLIPEELDATYDRLRPILLEEISG